MAKADPLEAYRSKRDFSVTREPARGGSPNNTSRSFVVQKHWARRLHYDFRLELDGTMKSWAVPKGPSVDSTDKRMAMHVEDHPISYSAFEGQIPARHYGAGKVIIWDKGVWIPEGDARKGYQAGKLKFQLHGHKLRGKWMLVRMKGKRTGRDPWLLIKEHDEFSRPAREFNVVDELPDSVARLGGPLAARRPAQAGKKPTGPTGQASTTPPQSSKKARAGQSKLPATLKPQLATLVETSARDPGQWAYEIKFDGYRLMTRIQEGRVRLYTRNGNDWTNKLTVLARRLKAAGLPEGWYDGEIVVLDEQALPNFQALQNALNSAAAANEIIYYLFDLPFCDGMDLRTEALIVRRKKLQEVLAHVESAFIRFSETFDVSGRDIVAAACRLGLEGVIGKKRSSLYVSGRSTDWIKLKCGLRQEFVIGGYTDPQGSRTGIGSLLLGAHQDGGSLKYVGNVGTGFSTRTLADITQRLHDLRAPGTPFSAPTGIDKKAHWVKPVLLAEVSFSQWTQNGRIRHAVFQGLRTDKPAVRIFKENPMPAGLTQPGSLLADVKISSPERIVDKSTGTTKMDVVRHYAQVAPLMLEHLKSRPVSLVRAPEGIEGQIFFQKHLETANMDGVRQLSAELDPGHAPLMEISSLRGLLNAAQMNVIEFHTWNAAKTAIARPDRMIFDLDPGKGVEWAAVQEAALAVRALLQELGLVPFVKTSGGKGLHLIVPLQRRHDWDTVKGFSRAVVVHAAQTSPARFSARSGPRNRIGKIFIDYLRNGFGATTVAAWSVRARPGMGVSVPVEWDEVNALQSAAHWHVGNVLERLEIGNQPWRDYRRQARTLTTAMRLLEYRPPS